MIEIRQISIRACPDFKDNIRAPRPHDMKTFVAGTAIKFIMIISESTATCTITISTPGFAATVDAAAMTREAGGIYSYEYQTPSDDVYTGKWIVTFSATYSGLTMVTQDKFTLITQDP